MLSLGLDHLGKCLENQLLFKSNDWNKMIDVQVCVLVHFELAVWRDMALECWCLERGFELLDTLAIMVHGLGDIFISCLIM